MCSSQTQPSQHLSHHLLSACCPCWGTVLSFTPPTDSFPSPGRRRGHHSGMSSLHFLRFSSCHSIFSLPSSLPRPHESCFVCSPSPPPPHCHHEENRLHILKTLTLPAPGSGPACPSSILNRERKNTGTSGYMTASALGQLQGTAESQNQTLMKVTGYDRVRPKEL